ncbi:SHREC complex intermodule linker subunit Clr1 [Schizosaccharomyces pombe]|uniref:Cryptic loci regulator protein 1 n=2 Tax=Schizosaccharomyces pombe (strain 972 / ATCC 24843) TaxID=284812 RepID=CLR1_SCHPO|nr:cryptic loci regulator Clr1 [Schizosaccharomyces pombe]O74808.1 RecName: Full=Cryptic loci regulator protein 1 [Schizosaccharomyces pombe 972h-]CAA21175.1 cryptic loci regulator Clr1 [Schizosaccharomyces pombe]|eukprot:NP_596236.1 cryptic loci regulator Clr1 [Schizosaccharomyces pombe]
MAEPDISSSETLTELQQLRLLYFFCFYHAAPFNVKTLVHSLIPPGALSYLLSTYDILRPWLMALRVREGPVNDISTIVQLYEEIVKTGFFINPPPFESYSQTLVARITTLGRPKLQVQQEAQSEVYQRASTNTQQQVSNVSHGNFKPNSSVNTEPNTSILSNSKYAGIKPFDFQSSSQNPGLVCEQKTFYQHQFRPFSNLPSNKSSPVKHVSPNVKNNSKKTASSVNSNHSSIPSSITKSNISSLDVYGSEKLISSGSQQPGHGMVQTTSDKVNASASLYDRSPSKKDITSSRNTSSYNLGSMRNPSTLKNAAHANPFEGLRFQGSSAVLKEGLNSTVKKTFFDNLNSEKVCPSVSPFLTPDNIASSILYSTASFSRSKPDRPRLNLSLELKLMQNELNKGQLKKQFKGDLRNLADWNNLSLVSSKFPSLPITNLRPDGSFLKHRRFNEEIAYNRQTLEKAIKQLDLSPDKVIQLREQNGVAVNGRVCYPTRNKHSEISAQSSSSLGVTKSLASEVYSSSTVDTISKLNTDKDNYLIKSKKEPIQQKSVSSETTLVKPSSTSSYIDTTNNVLKTNSSFKSSGLTSGPRNEKELLPEGIPTSHNNSETQAQTADVSNIAASADGIYNSDQEKPPEKLDVTKRAFGREIENSNEKELLTSTFLSPSAESQVCLAEIKTIRPGLVPKKQFSVDQNNVISDNTDCSLPKPSNSKLSSISSDGDASSNRMAVPDKSPFVHAAPNSKALTKDSFSTHISVSSLLHSDNEISPIDSTRKDYFTSKDSNLQTLKEDASSTKQAKDSGTNDFDKLISGNDVSKNNSGEEQSRSALKPLISGKLSSCESINLTKDISTVKRKEYFGIESTSSKQPFHDTGSIKIPAKRSFDTIDKDFRSSNIPFADKIKEDGGDKNVISSIHITTELPKSMPVEVPTNAGAQSDQSNVVDSESLNLRENISTSVADVSLSQAGNEAVLSKKACKPLVLIDPFEEKVLKAFNMLSKGYAEYRCQWEGCLANLHSLENFIKHVLLLHHPKSCSVVKCLWASCDMVLPSEEFEMHLRGHLNNIRLNCEVSNCKKCFSNYEDMFKHLQHSHLPFKFTPESFIKIRNGNVKEEARRTRNAYTQKSGEVECFMETCTPIAKPAPANWYPVPPPGFNSSLLSRLTQSNQSKDKIIAALAKRNVYKSFAGLYDSKGKNDNTGYDFDSNYARVGRHGSFILPVSKSVPTPSLLIEGSIVQRKNIKIE